LTQVSASVDQMHIQRNLALTYHMSCLWTASEKALVERAWSLQYRMRTLLEAWPETNRVR
jgi:hypothetical protein